MLVGVTAAAEEEEDAASVSLLRLSWSTSHILTVASVLQVKRRWPVSSLQTERTKPSWALALHWQRRCGSDQSLSSPSQPPLAIQPSSCRTRLRLHTPSLCPSSEYRKGLANSRSYLTALRARVYSRC